MPTHTSNRKRGKAGLALAPAVPLAIALIHGALIPPKPGGQLIEGPNEEELVTQPVKCEEPLEGFEACHSKYPAGCSTGGKYDPYLNLLKNQTAFTGAPVRFLTGQSDFVALEKKIPSDLGKDNHADDKDALAQAGEGKLHGVIGYLYDAKPEDKESSNCELPRDTP